MPAFAQSSGQSCAAGASFLACVAKNLGSDEAKLTAAMNAAHVETIDEALAAGRILVEQVAAVKERSTAETAMDWLAGDGISSARITCEHDQLLGGRGLEGPIMGGRRSGDGRLIDGIERAGAACGRSTGFGPGR